MLMYTCYMSEVSTIVYHCHDVTLLVTNCFQWQVFCMCSLVTDESGHVMYVAMEQRCENANV